MAAYVVWSYTFKTTVIEPITVEVIKELEDPLYPGQQGSAEYIVTNNGNTSLEVTATWPGEEEDPIKCHATIYYIDSEGERTKDITKVDYDGEETFTLDTSGEAAGKRYMVKVELSVLVGDAPPGEYEFPVSIARL